MRRVNKPKNPAERIDNWAGPRLEEFYGGGPALTPEPAPAPKPAVEEKPAIAEPRKGRSAKLDEEMKQRGWHTSTLSFWGFGKGRASAWIMEVHGGKGGNEISYQAFYSEGGSGSRTLHSPEEPVFDTAVAYLLKMVDEPAYRDQLEEEQSDEIEKEETGGTSEARRELNQAAIVEEENAEPEEAPDSLDGFRSGLGYYEDAFNKATDGEFYGDAGGVGFSVEGIKRYEELLRKHPGAAPALAAGFANEKAFLEAYGAPDPKDVRLVAQVEQLLRKYGVMLPPRGPELTEWPWAELEKEANALGWYREKGLASKDGIFLREKASEQRSVDIDRDATGLWIVYGEGGRFTSASAKKAGEWLLNDLKSLKEFKAGDYIGVAGSWYNHNVYRLTSPAGPGKWNVLNIEHMPKHVPVSVLEEKDMVKFVGYKTPEEHEAESLAKKRAMQKKWLENAQWADEGLKGQLDLNEYLKSLRAKHVPEEYIRQIQDSYGDPREDPIRHILASGFVIRNLKQVPVRGLKDWPTFVMENGEEVNVNFINRSATGGYAGSNSFLRDLNGEDRDEDEKAKVIDHDDPARGIKANYNAELPDGVLVRVTPPGQPTVEQLVKPGDIVHEVSNAPGMVGESGKPYEKDHWVLGVHKYLEYGLPVYSLRITDPGEQPTGSKGRFRETQVGGINDLVAQDGVIHEFFQESDDEYKVVGHKDLPMGPTLTGQLEVEPEEEPEEEETDEE